MASTTTLSRKRASASDTVRPSRSGKEKARGAEASLTPVCLQRGVHQHPPEPAQYQSKQRPGGIRRLYADGNRQRFYSGGLSLAKRYRKPTESGHRLREFEHSHRYHAGFLGRPPTRRPSTSSRTCSVSVQAASRWDPPPLR